MVRIGAVSAMVLALCTCATLSAQESERHTRRALHKLMREADTPEKRERVSAYCDRIAKDLRALAQAEQAAVTGYGSEIRAGSSKYPNQSDSARSLSAHYSYEATRIGKLADTYRVEHKVPAQLDVKKKTEPAYTDVEQQLLKRIDGLEEQIRTLKAQPTEAATPPKS